MKLGEALVARKDSEKRYAEIMQRLQQNLVVEKGTEPQFDPTHLAAEAGAIIDRQAALIAQINKTNSTTVVESENGKTIADLIAERDRLTKRRLFLDTIVKSSRPRRDRQYGEGEVVEYTPLLDVAAHVRLMDSTSAELRRIDTVLQGLNWTVDLIE